MRRGTIAFRYFTALLLFVFASGNSPSQRPSTNLPACCRFEIMSVKERVGYDRPNPLRLQWTTDGYIAEGMPVDWIISSAYGIRSQYIVQLPEWAKAKRFDVLLKVAPEDVPRFATLKISEKAAMLRQVLEERFRLAKHFDPRIIQVYELVKRPQAPKLIARPAGPEEAQRKRLIVGGDMLRAESVGMTDLANTLSNLAGRKVIDKTEISGVCDFTLRWSNDEGVTGAHSTSSEYPSIFEAIKEQLGLELRPSKAPIDFLVIDHIEMPSSN